MKEKNATMIVLAAATQLIDNIGTDAAYAWAQQRATLQKVRTPRDEIETFKCSSQFWSGIFTAPDFAKHMKMKNWSDQYIREETDRTGELIKKKDNLDQATKALKRMHARFTEAVWEVCS